MDGMPGSREEPSDGSQDRTIAGRYRLRDVLGVGGMGTVWRARDEALGREVAVKEVRAPSGLPADDVARLHARLEREAWAAARIPHRNVVKVHDVVTEEGRPWIVTELVRGLTLSDVLEAEGPMAPEPAARIGAEVLAALRAAHEAGVLHRDIKPGNVLIAQDGRIVLTDFGITPAEDSSALTTTGEVVGSPEFLAPERALGRRPGPESDLWALGILLWTAVEGSTPFRHDSSLRTLRAIVDDELPPAERAGALLPVIEGLLRKDPADRTSAEQAERDLRAVGAGGTATGFAGPGSDRAPTAGTHRPQAGTEQAPRSGRATAPTPSLSRARSDGPVANAATAAPERRRRKALVVAAAVLALLIGGAAYVLMDDDRAEPGGGKGGGPTQGMGPDAAATYRNSVGIEAHGPVRATSKKVALTVRCVQRTPAGGASCTADTGR